jgi:hypothetical protein
LTSSKCDTSRSWCETGPISALPKVREYRRCPSRPIPIWWPPRSRHPSSGVSPQAAVRPADEPDVWNRYTSRLTVD